MTDDGRLALLETIRSNISTHGYHVTLVSGASHPRFAYTIGLSATAGAELVLAGASWFTANEVERIIREIAGRIVPSADHWSAASVELDGLGVFSLRAAHRTWANALLLGALDVYGTDEIAAAQILPDAEHWTLDIPDMGAPWSATAEPVWRWIHEPWEHAVPSNSVATTNLGALRGDRVTEAARWEVDYWEMFAGPGPDVPPEDVRVVPFGTMLGADASLDAVMSLEIGQGLWRDGSVLEWHAWIPTDA